MLRYSVKTLQKPRSSLVRRCGGPLNQVATFSSAVKSGVDDRKSKGLLLTGVAVGLAGAAWLMQENSRSYCAGAADGDVGSCKRTSSHRRPGPHDISQDEVFSVGDTKDFAFIVAGAGSAGCLTAYLLAKWLEDRQLPGKVLLLDRGPDFDGQNGPDPVMESWFGNWGIFGEAHAAYREDGSDYPVTPTSHNGVGGCGTHDTRISFIMRPEQRKRVAEKMGWTEEQCAMYFQAALDMIPLLPAMPEEEEFYTTIVKSLTDPSNPFHLNRLIDNFGGNGNGSKFGDRDVYIRAEPVRDTIGQPLLAMYNNELRWTSAYLLRPGAHRPRNLVVVPNAVVDKVVFAGEQPVATEVKFSVGNKHFRAAVSPTGGEVALTSGAIGNVGILQRSGVGPRQVLEKLHIPVVADNPLVGRGVDHPEISIMYEWVRKVDDLPRGGVNGWPMVLFATTLPTEAKADGTPAHQPVDFMAHFGAGYAEPYTAFPSVLATPNCMQPSLQAGYLATITSTRPTDSLLLTHMNQHMDWELMARGVQRMEKVFAQAQKDRLVGQRLLPPMEVNLQDLAVLTDYVKENHFTVFHWACTTRAGKDAHDAAADEAFRVRLIAGTAIDASTTSSSPAVVANLRVGSASALPEISEANPHMSIHAFSFALAHTLVDAYAQTAANEATCACQRKKAAALATTLPVELQRAQHTVQESHGRLVVRRDGEEWPKLGRVALEYYAQWKQAHPDDGPDN